MRRKDREMGLEFALEVIDKSSFATMAAAGEEGEPYCLPLSMARIEGNLYFHCAKEGKKLEYLKKNPRVCVSFVGDIHIPEGKFTTEYESAIAFGTAYEVTQREEKTEALRAICQKYTPDNMENFDRALEKSFEITAVWGIRMERITGKQKKAKK